MNLIDKVVSYFAPKSALTRVQARKALRYYDVAKPGPRTKKWKRPSGTANAAMDGKIKTLINTSRELRRNSGIANSAINIFANTVVGKGIIPSPDTGDNDLDVAIMEVFDVWKKECDSEGVHSFYGLQMIATQTILESGSVLVRRRYRRLSDNLSLPIQIQILEPDQLNDYVTVKTGSNRIFNGIEVSALGKPVRYHLFKYHPDDIGLFSQYTTETSVVPARDITIAFDKERPGQLLGKPMLTPIAMDIRDLDDYEQAEIVRKKVESCFTMAVTTPDRDNLSVGVQDTDYTDRRVERINPASILYLEPQESVQFGQPASVGGYFEFIKAHKMKISTGVNMHYPLLSGDLADVNYSSYRAGNVVFQGAIKKFREHCLIPMFCEPIWRWMIDTAIFMGKLPSNNPKIYRVEWTPPAFVSVDPEKDAKTDLLENRALYTSWEDSVRKRGGNPKKILAETAKLLANLEEMGLESDVDVRKMARSGIKHKDMSDAETQGKPSK